MEGLVSRAHVTQGGSAILLRFKPMKEVGMKEAFSAGNRWRVNGKQQPREMLPAEYH